MHVLLIGSGGREHAIAVKLRESPLLTRLSAAPGNAGIAGVAEIAERLDTSRHDAVVNWCRQNGVDLVVVGPEAPLVAGLVDDLTAAGIKAFGPSKAAARLEGSKAFTKELCDEAGLPTAAWARFTSAGPAKAYVAASGAPIVVKADGLAAGKGVVVASSVEEANAAIDACFSGAFGAAGAEVVIEEMLFGEEASFFAICDGRTALPLAAAQDHKRAHDGDTGPNTGGMGAYSPTPLVSDNMADRIMAEIVRPTIATLAGRGTPFVGILFAGLMIGDEGPKLIEFNVRLGDPETQVILPRMTSDLLALMLAAVDGRLEEAEASFDDGAALTVVLAANGYPGQYETGSVISAVPEASPEVRVYHAGTARDEAGRLIATGGRVLAVTAKGATVAEAQRRAYDAVAAVDWPGGFHRRDIGWRAVGRT